MPGQPECIKRAQGSCGWRAGVCEILYGDNHSSIFSIFHNLCVFTEIGGWGFLTVVDTLGLGGMVFVIILNLMIGLSGLNINVTMTYFYVVQSIAIALALARVV